MPRVQVGSLEKIRAAFCEARRGYFRLYRVLDQTKASQALRDDA
jgi:hypothetical protein